MRQCVLAVGRTLPNGEVSLLGSCFEVSERIFATAAHVVGISDDKLVVVRNNNFADDGYQDTTNTSCFVEKVNIVEYDPIRDIALIQAAPASQYYITTRWNKPTKRLATLVDSDDIRSGTSLSTLGYPHATYGRFVLTQHNCTVGARVMLGSSDEKIKHLVLNILARPGQSGGPVFSPNGIDVCAMVIGSYTPNRSGMTIGDFDPSTLHQTTHAVSAEYIKDMLECFTSK